MIEYVLGFAFDVPLKRVVLILKNRPLFQHGKLNGVGGKVERGEAPVAAMRREFKEETGMDLRDWWNFGQLILVNQVGVLHLFYTIDDIGMVRTMTDEPVLTLPIQEVIHSQALVVMPNIRWMIPMALSFEEGEMCSAFEVAEISRT